MAKGLSTHIEFIIRPIEQGKEVKGLVVVTAGGRVQVSVPERVVGERTRQEARRLCETLGRALDETEP